MDKKETPMERQPPHRQQPAGAPARGKGMRGVGRTKMTGGGDGGGGSNVSGPPKAFFVIKMCNLALFLILFSIVVFFVVDLHTLIRYEILDNDHGIHLRYGFRPSFPGYRCRDDEYRSLSEAEGKVEDAIPVTPPAVDEKARMWLPKSTEKKMVLPKFLQTNDQGARIALVNIEPDQWPENYSNGVELEEASFKPLNPNLTWKQFFPEWIDEEQIHEVPTCPEVPMPDFEKHGEVAAVVVRLPEMAATAAAGAGRDLFSLQVNLVAAKLAVRKGRRDGRGRVKVVFYGDRRPMMEVFRCDDLTRREGNWWLYEPEKRRLEAVVGLPVGSCQLALPLSKGSSEEMYSLPSSGDPPHPRPEKPEAYATALHSSDRYVCGAITLAQSLRDTGTTRDLVLLHDRSIPADKLRALAAVGWKLRLITRIRNPHADDTAYNAYNYSKLRLWQLVEYSKVVFVDADILVLRNLDVLFGLPELSATGNDGVIFNSGIVVIEPSECTFRGMMRRSKDIVPYNGGDQGFLNEIFTWWHRLPRRANYMKLKWSNTAEERREKDGLFAADPPELYSIHYLGMKPWTCYRDYDCNWNLKNHHPYASDPAHRRWWAVHDRLPKRLTRHCRLTPSRKVSLEGHRRAAMAKEFADGHWRLNVTDERQWL